MANSYSSKKYWWVSGDLPEGVANPYVELTFDAEKAINQIDLYYFATDSKYYYLPTDYTISYKSGDTWIPVVTVEDNTTELTSKAHSFETVTTTAIRIDITEDSQISKATGIVKTITPGQSRLSEIEVYNTDGVNVATNGTIAVSSSHAKYTNTSVMKDGYRNNTDGIGWQLTEIPVGQTEESNSNE